MINNCTQAYFKLPLARTLLSCIQQLIPRPCRVQYLACRTELISAADPPRTVRKSLYLSLCSCELIVSGVLQQTIVCPCAPRLWTPTGRSLISDLRLVISLSDRTQPSVSPVTFRCLAVKNTSALHGGVTRHCVSPFVYILFRQTRRASCSVRRCEGPTRVLSFLTDGYSHTAAFQQRMCEHFAVSVDCLLAAEVRYSYYERLD